MVTTSLLPDGTLLQIGTRGADNLTGDNVFAGQSRPNDEIRAGGGRDSLSGGRGQNDLFGQDGADTILVGQANNEYDRAFGGKGADTFLLLNEPGAFGKTHLINGGNDPSKPNSFDSLSLSAVLNEPANLAREKVSVVTVSGQLDVAVLKGIEVIGGTSLGDSLRASGAIVEISGFGGNDRIWANDTAKGVYAGGAGNDTMKGRASDDTLYDGDLGIAGGRNAPNAFNDTDLLEGNGGNDTLYSYSGDDTLVGGKGDDRFFSVFGADTIRGGDDNDTVKFNFGNWVNSALVDQTKTNRPQDQLAGLNMNGGDGIDKIDFSATYSRPSFGNYDPDKGVFANLGSGNGRELGTGNDGAFRMRNFENVTGTSREDTLIGSALGNRIDGGGGNDTLKGKGGKDVVEGGLGNDMLSGGKGADTFRFFDRDGADTILDFQDGVDRIKIDMAGGKLSFASLTITDTANGALITYATGGTIALDGVFASSLDAGDFLFT